MVINSRLFRVIRNTKSAITNGRCNIPNIHINRPLAGVVEPLPEIHLLFTYK